MPTKRKTKSSKKTTTKDASSPQENTKAPADHTLSRPPKSLYEKEIDGYRAFLKRGFDTAYRFYGFTLFHSLSPEEKVGLFQKLGFEPKNPEDFYNLGCLAVKKGDYTTARDFFQKTLELAADFEEAYYNLALTQEHLDDEKAAINNWEIYNEFLDEDSSEAIVVSEHIAELKAHKADIEQKKSRKK